MRYKQITTICILAATTALASCQSSRLGSLNTQPVVNSPAPLPAAPSGTVEQGTLTPPSVQPAENFPTAPSAPTIATPTAPKEPEVASLPTETGGPVTREQMVGAWKVSTAGSSCQMFLALTKWSGGFRAASRGCPGAAANVTAWNVAGNQVQLKDSTGSTVAVLLSSGPTRYAGTAGGSPITLSR